MPNGERLPWTFQWAGDPKLCAAASAAFQMKQCFRNYLNPIRKLKHPVICYKGVTTADSQLRMEYLEAVQMRRTSMLPPPGKTGAGTDADSTVQPDQKHGGPQVNLEGKAHHSVAPVTVASSSVVEPGAVAQFSTAAKDQDLNRLMFGADEKGGVMGDPGLLPTLPQPLTKFGGGQSTTYEGHTHKRSKLKGAGMASTKVKLTLVDDFPSSSGSSASDEERPSSGGLGMRASPREVTVVSSAAAYAQRNKHKRAEKLGMEAALAAGDERAALQGRHMATPVYLSAAEVAADTDADASDIDPVAENKALAVRCCKESGFNLEIWKHPLLKQASDELFAANASVGALNPAEVRGHLERAVCLMEAQLEHAMSAGSGGDTAKVAEAAAWTGQQTAPVGIAGAGESAEFFQQWKTAAAISFTHLSESKSLNAPGAGSGEDADDLGRGRVLGSKKRKEPAQAILPPKQMVEPEAYELESVRFLLPLVKTRLQEVIAVEAALRDGEDLEEEIDGLQQLLSKTCSISCHPNPPPMLAH